MVIPKHPFYGPFSVEGVFTKEIENDAACFITNGVLDMCKFFSVGALCAVVHCWNKMLLAF